MASLNIFALTSFTCNLALSGTSARAQMVSADILIPPGTYRVASTVDCFLAQGGASVAATTSSIVFPAGVEYIDIRTETYIAGITASGTGAMTITRVA